ncbi:MAG: NADPH-dependent FMN reductase [Microthrixaceae bacterium]
MRVLVVSPHFDDAPLSLGQSMLDGALRDSAITVGIVFSRSNWTRWIHPRRSRTPAVSAIRRVEETVNARRFGYRVRTAGFEEAVLRSGDADPRRLLDPGVDPRASPYLRPITDRLRCWAERVDVVVAPLGIGDHVDHRLCSAACSDLAGDGVEVVWYEDRPYSTWCTPEAVASRAHELDDTLVRRAAGTPIGPAKRRLVFYPSQLDEGFRARSTATSGWAGAKACGAVRHRRGHRRCGIPPRTTRRPRRPATGTIRRMPRDTSPFAIAEGPVSGSGTLVVVGNPRRGSRTGQVAERVGYHLARRTSQPDDYSVVELATCARHLTEWGHADVTRLVERVAGARALVIASPTFKASFSGLLKCFLDQIDADGLTSASVVVPVMTGAGSAHSLAVETQLRPVLVELGASMPTRGLYVSGADLDNPVDAVDRWYANVAPTLDRVAWT